jgi:hypothetical protein
VIAMAKVKQINPDNQILIEALTELLDLANKGQLKTMALALTDIDGNKKVAFFSDTLDERFVLVNELQMQIIYDKMGIITDENGL